MCSQDMKVDRFWQAVMEAERLAFGMTEKGGSVFAQLVARLDGSELGGTDLVKLHMAVWESDAVEIPSGILWYDPLVYL